MDTYSIVIAGPFMFIMMIMEFKDHMKLLMDDEDNGVMLNRMKEKIERFKNVEIEIDFVDKVNKLPFSLKEKYKILYCALYEKQLTDKSAFPPVQHLDEIKNWKEANGYGHLDCSHLYKPGDTEATEATEDTNVIREIIYILHNTSLE